MFTSNNTIPFNKLILDPKITYVMFNIAIFRIFFYFQGFILDQIPKTFKIESRNNKRKKKSRRKGTL